MKSFNGICFGEVLIDKLLSGEKVVGGAPFNVTSRLNSLGIPTKIISAIGKDEFGEIISDYITLNKLTNELIALHDTLSSGQVTISISNSGDASYDIMYPVAWDEIILTTLQLESVKNSDIFIYGSLAARNSISRKTLFELLNYAKFKIFDVNLRKPFYNKEGLLALMHKADFIKFNEEEIDEISKFFSTVRASLEEKILLISKETNTPIICVTMGKNGAVLYQNNTFYYQAGFDIKVIDTIGSGDSFLAALLSKLILNDSPQIALEFACAMGALVATKKGANELISASEIKSLLNK